MSYQQLGEKGIKRKRKKGKKLLLLRTLKAEEGRI